MVVLYRPGWGESGFTSVEATAIRNRAHKTNFDFTTFILLDPPAAPPWLPATRIWGTLAEKGIDHAVTVVESRILEHGGSVAAETAASVAATLRRRLEAKARRDELLASPNLYQTALEEFGTLAAVVEDLVRATELLQSHRQGQLPGQAPQRQLTIAGREGWRSSISFSQHAWRSPDECHLIVQLFQPSSGKSTTSGYRFDADDEGRQLGWRECEPELEVGRRYVIFKGTGASPRFLSTEALADETVRNLLRAIGEHL